MYVKVVGKPARDMSNTMVKKATQFFGDYLMGKRLSDKVYVRIEFKKFKKHSNEYAYVDWIDDNHCPREYIITIANDLSMKETLLALAHEMVHVKQYAKGELKDIFRPVRSVRWMGEHYNVENEDYWELPFEIEAYGREKGLYVKFMDKLRNDSF